MGKLVRLTQDSITGEVFYRGDYNTFREPLDLVCDKETGIVYYKFSEKINIVVKGELLTTKVGYMSPFITKGGEICYFGKGEIITGKLTRLVQDTNTGKLHPKGRYGPTLEPLNLVYDEVTKIVYYKFSEKVALVINDELVTSKLGYMSPYIGPN